MELGNFAKPFITDIWEFFDALVYKEPKQQKRLPDYSGHETMTYALYRLTGILENEEPNKKLQIGKLRVELREKYPEFKW